MIDSHKLIIRTWSITLRHSKGMAYTCIYMWSYISYFVDHWILSLAWCLQCIYVIMCYAICVIYCPFYCFLIIFLMLKNFTLVIFFTFGSLITEKHEHINNPKMSGMGTYIPVPCFECICGSFVEVTFHDWSLGWVKGHIPQGILWQQYR